MKASQAFRRVALAINLLLAALVAASSLPLPAEATGRPSLVHVRGSQPFLFVLCKLPGQPAEPQVPAFFETMLLGPGPSLDDYWAHVSFGQIDLHGSAVAGWYNLPQAAGLFSAAGTVDRERLAAECMKAIRADYDLARFAALGLVFNSDLESQPRAGEACMDQGGASECHKVIWMWPLMMRNQATWAHEMGHIFGLPHSTDASGDPYANVWDVMSGSTSCTYGDDKEAMGQYPIADQLDRLGWIPSTRRLVVPPEATRELELHGLAQPGHTGYLLVRVPLQSAGRYYTVEARLRTGYDSWIPANAVLIHLVDPVDVEHPAQLVAHPGEASGALAGIWRPGEVFSDPLNRVSISVDARTTDGFRITVNAGSAFEAGRVVPKDLLPKTAAASTSVRDAAGRTYRVREERNGRDWDIYVTELTPDGRVASDRRINDDTGTTWQGSPAIAADAAGNVTVVWVDRRSGASEIYAATRAADGKWGANVRLAKAGIDTYATPALKLDEDGQVQATWIASPACGRAKGQILTLMTAKM